MYIQPAVQFTGNLDVFYKTLILITTMSSNWHT